MSALFDIVISVVNHTIVQLSCIPMNQMFLLLINVKKLFASLRVRSRLVVVLRDHYFHVKVVKGEESAFTKRLNVSQHERFCGYVTFPCGRAMSLVEIFIACFPVGDKASRNK